MYKLPGIVPRLSDSSQRRILRKTVSKKRHKLVLHDNEESSKCRIIFNNHMLLK